MLSKWSQMIEICYLGLCLWSLEDLAGFRSGCRPNCNQGKCWKPHIFRLAYLISFNLSLLFLKNAPWISEEQELFRKKEGEPFLGLLRLPVYSLSAVDKAILKRKPCAQKCPTLCNPMDCSPPGSSVRGIFQARILEWVAIFSSGALLNPMIKPTSPALQDSLPLSHQGSSLRESWRMPWMFPSSVALCVGDTGRTEEEKRWKMLGKRFDYFLFAYSETQTKLYLLAETILYL